MTALNDIKIRAFTSPLSSILFPGIFCVAGALKKFIQRRSLASSDCLPVGRLSVCHVRLLTWTLPVAKMVISTGRRTICGLVGQTLLPPHCAFMAGLKTDGNLHNSIVSHSSRFLTHSLDLSFSLS